MLKKLKQRNNGITLISLITTIIILLILAGVTIGILTGNNGVIENAQKAKKDTEIANEKEIIDTAVIQAMGNNKRGNLVESELKDELDKVTGTGETEVSDIGEELEIVFTDTKRYYTVDKNGNIIDESEIVEDKSPGDITKDENGQDIAGDRPYEIWCIEDLIEFSNNYEIYQNSNVNLCRNLNFKSKYSYANSETIDYGDINEDGTTDILIQEMQKGKGFIPIADFSGVFNGSNFEIRNIYIVNSQNVGLFRKINGATISNLGISGYIESTEITNIEFGIGGIVGNIRTSNGKRSYIENCWNNAVIKGFLNQNYTGVGGIVGQASNETDIVNCVNRGAIMGEIGTGAYSGINAVGVAGILGYVRGNTAYVNIYNSYNSGSISCDKTSCGIVGGKWAEGSINIENCVNIGQAQVGIGKGTSTSNNVYFLESASTTGGTSSAISVSEDELYTEDFISKLNNYINQEESYKSNWKKWTLGTDKELTFEKEDF